jgi:hypothetical protein
MGLLMFRKTAAAAALGAGLLLAVAGSASAYTMDSAGAGWVGKGEVQTAYGWNNKAMQDNVSGVTFAYDSTSTYEVVCEFDNPGGHHVITNTKRSSVQATVGSDARNNSSGKQGPMTGWYLTGFGAVTSTGQTVPAVGDGCPGNSGLGAITSVTQTGSGAGGLYALWSGQSRLLTLTVATTTL